LVEKAEIVEKSAKKFESSIPKREMGYEQKRTRQNGTVFQFKRERNYVCEVVRGTPPKTKKRGVSIRSLSFLRNNTPSKRSRWLQYSICFKRGIS